MVTARFLRFAEVIAELDHVDDPDVLERSKSSPALQAALVMSRPENWWGTGISPEKLLKIAESDGIPIVWLPDGETLVALVAACNKAARAQVLIERTGQIVEDCVRTFGECTDPWLADQVKLARQAIAAFPDHPETAMSHAVMVSEALAVWGSTPRVQAFDSQQQQEAWTQKLGNTSRYGWARLELERADSAGKKSGMYWRALAAPIPSFFTDWHPYRNMAIPPNLSRHVVAHNPVAEH
ncbi:MAG: hypothetical protein ACJ786_33305 [Catenulispora sp.]